MEQIALQDSLKHNSGHPLILFKNLHFLIDS